MLTVALGHFSVDFSAQLVTMMYPFLAVSLGLSYGLIGLAALVWATATSTTQPLFGYLGDRFGRRWLASASPAWAAVWIGAVAFAPSYPLVLVFLMLGGIGVGAFHPQGAASANEATTQRKSASVATFFLGGHLGFAISPLLAAVVLASGGLRWLPVLLAPTFIVAGVIAVGLRGAQVPAARLAAVARRRTAGLKRAVTALLLVVVVRGWAYASFNTFVPLFVSPDSPDPARAGLVLAAFLAGHAAGAFGGGVLADRVGVRRMVGYSSAITVPLILAFGLAPFGPWHFALAAGAGVAIGAGFTPSIVLMQGLLPGRMGAASGVALGVSFGAGAVGNLVTGLVGDAAGLDVAFALLAVAQIAVLAALRWVPSAGRGATRIASPRSQPAV